MLRSGKKSDLVSCLQTDSPSHFGKADVKLIDGANMVHALGSDSSIKTFHDYAENKVIPFIKQHLITARRVDVIWERYLSDSLNATTGENKGAGVRQRLLSDGKLLKNWKSYFSKAANCFSTYQECLPNLLSMEGCLYNI